MKKKIIALVLAVTTLVVAVALGGTLAYLTDNSSSVNVATMGNVKVKQYEYQLDGTALVDFKQGQPLYPAYAAEADAYTDFDEVTWPDVNKAGVTPTSKLWNDTKLVGVMDKMVFVENTGRSDAFYRTWIALECPEGVVISDDPEKADIMVNKTAGDLFTWTALTDTVTVDGRDFYVLCAVSNSVLQPGETDMPSLLQVVMTKNATNEDTEAIGKTFEILAFTQAVQTNNFEESGPAAALVEAFGPISAEENPWGADFEINITAPINAEDLELSLAMGGEIYLANDIVLDKPVTVPAGIEAILDLNGYTLTTAYDETTEKHAYAIDNEGTLEIRGGTIEARGIYNRDGATLTVNNAEIVNLDKNGGSCIWSFGGKVYLNNAKLTGYTGCVYSEGYLEINGGEYICYSAIEDDGTQIVPTYNIRAYDGLKITGGNFTSRHGLVSVMGGESVIEGGTFTMNSIGVITSHVIYVAGTNNDVEISGGTFNCDLTTAHNNGSSLICKMPGSGDVSVIGGTFNLDPKDYVAADEGVVKDNGDNTFTVFPATDTWDGTADISWYPTVATAAAATEAKTYKLWTAEQFAGFAELVNVHGVSFPGETIELMVNVDLQGKPWAPIGHTLTAEEKAEGAQPFDYQFRGDSSVAKYAIFNGNGKTVSNLNVDVAANAGLFGVAVYAEIHDVTVENAVLKSNHFAGTVLAQGYARVEGCNVKNTKINVTPELINGSWDNGDKVGGVVGKISEASVGTRYGVYDCTIDTADISAYRDIGGILGFASHYVTISGNDVKNVTLTQDNTHDYKAFATAAEYNVNLIVGDSTRHNGVVVENNTVDGQPIVDKEEVADAFANVQNNSTIVLPSGTFSAPDTTNKTFTIKGTGNTTFVAQNDGASEGNCDYSFSGSNVTFEDLTITTTGTYFPGYARMKGTFINCTFNNVYALYDDSTFKNCTFNISGDLYNIWTWGATNATFENCTFNSDGKAILLYGAANTNLTLINCTFNDNGGLDDLKAAVEIGNDYGKSYTLTVKNTKVNGYEINDKGTLTGTTLWANKNSMKPENLTVTVDDVVVYGGADKVTTLFLDSAEGLVAFANSVNKGGNTYSGKTVKLMADIDLAGIDWEPIGQTGATQFKGIFDGNGHTIKNLTVDSIAETGKHYSSGLFGWLNAATVKNVKVEGATVEGCHNVGVIAGYMETSGCTISNCHVVKATVYAEHANDDACGDKVGGIVGHAGNAGVVVEKCTVKESTISAGRDAGQVVGAALTANIKDCSATNVTVSATAGCTDSGAGTNLNEAVIGRVLG